MHLVLEHTETGDRTALYGVRDFQIQHDEETVIVFWPTYSIDTDTYDINTVQHVENHRFVNAVDSQAHDLQSLLDRIHLQDQEDYDLTIVPSEMYPIYQRAIREIGHDDSFSDPTNYTPTTTVEA